MLASILATKLHIPPHRHKAVHRPRLLEQLSEGLKLIEVFDVKGKLVLSETTTEAIRTALDLSTLQKGNYIVKVSDQLANQIQERVAVN